MQRLRARVPRRQQRDPVEGEKGAAQIGNVRRGAGPADFGQEVAFLDPAFALDPAGRDPFRMHGARFADPVLLEHDRIEIPDRHCDPNDDKADPRY
ncbi:MAG: hypothetical protein VW547_01380 [Alphaproteobacteria bacterium]